MARRPEIALFVLALGGCAESVVVVEAAGPWQSALTLTGDELTAHDGGDSIRFTPSFEDDVEVVAVFYDAPLASLGIAAGLVPLGSGRTRGVPRPFSSALFATVTPALQVTKEALAPGDPRLSRLRLPALDEERCAMAGRCLALEGDLVCSDRCAAPVLAPAPVVAEVIEPTPPSATPARTPCSVGQAQWRTASACAPIGAACPADGWPANVPGGRPVRWVRPSGGLGPHGEAVDTTIAAAIAGAPANTVIALSSGTHAGGFDLGATLIGACAAETRIDGAIRVNAPSTIADVTIAGGAHVLLGASLDLASAAIASPLRVSGALVARDLAVQGVVTTDPTAIARLDRVVFSGTVADALISAGSTTLSDAVLESSGLRFEGAGSRAVVHDVEIVSSPGVTAGGLVADRGANMDVARARLTGRFEKAIAFMHGASGAVVDAHLTSPSPDVARPGSAILVQDASATFERVAIDGAINHGVYTTSASVSFTDLRVAGSHAWGHNDAEATVYIDNASSATIVRAALEVTDGPALQVAFSACTVEDLLVINGRAPVDLDATFRQGIFAQAGGNVVVRRVKGRDLSGPFIHADGENSVIDVEGATYNGGSSLSATAEHGGLIQAKDISFVDVAYAIFIGTNGTLHADGLLVSDVIGTRGGGLAVGDDAVIELKNFVITRAAGVAFDILARGSGVRGPPTMTLEEGELRESNVGLQNLLGEMEMEHLTTRNVRLIGNQIDIQP